MDAELSIPSVRREKAYLRIVDIVINLVAEGKVAYRDKFYTEQELMSILGVSRPTLREALRVLEFLGVTTVSPRNGISINQPNDRDGYLPLLYTLAFEKTTARELFEVRRALQLEMVALAAEHHTQEDLDALRALIEQMRSDPDASAEEFARLDYQFHQQIICIAKNRLALKLSSTISPLIHDQLTEHQKRHNTAKNRAGTIECHEEILRCIEQGDAEKARRCMASHLSSSQSFAQEVGDTPISFTMR